MTQWLKQSTAATVKFGPFKDEDDGKTALTSLTISQADIRLSKNGGDYAQTNNSAGASHDEAGEYDVPLDTTDTNTLGRLRVRVSESGALDVWQDFMVVPANVWDSMFGSDKLEVDAVQIDGDGDPAATTMLGVVQFAIEDNNLDHVAKAVAGSGDITTNSALGKLAADNGVWGDFDPTTDSLEALRNNVGAAGAGLTAIPWNASWDAEVQSECTAALNAYDPPTRAEATADKDEILVATIDANLVEFGGIAITERIQENWVALYHNGDEESTLHLDDIALHSGFSNIQLPSNGLANVTAWTVAITGNITGNLSGSVGSVTGDINTGSGTITTLDALDTAQDSQHATTQAAITTVDGVADAIKLKTDNFPSDPADASDIAAAFSTVNTTLSTIAGYLDTEIAAIKAVTDALTAAAAAKIATSAGTMLTGTIDSTGHTPTTTEFEADDITEATADHFNGRIILFTSGALQYQATSISDYSLVSGRGHFTVVALTEAPANNSTFIII